jgi:hypothetical protein
MDSLLKTLDGSEASEGQGRVHPAHLSRCRQFLQIIQSWFLLMISGPIYNRSDYPAGLQWTWDRHPPVKKRFFWDSNFLSSLLCNESVQHPKSSRNDPPIDVVRIGERQRKEAFVYLRAF